MGEPAVMGKCENRTAEPAQHVQIWRLSRQRHGRGRECSLPIEAGTSHTRAGKKMRDRFQDPPRERLPEMKNENTTGAGFPLDYGTGSIIRSSQ